MLFYAFEWQILNNEKPDGICLPNFVVDEFSGLFLDPSIFSIKH